MAVNKSLRYFSFEMKIGLSKELFTVVAGKDSFFKSNQFTLNDIVPVLNFKVFFNNHEGIDGLRNF